MEDGYNYEHFPLEFTLDRAALFRQVLQAGDAAPDGHVLDLRSGEQINLAGAWDQQDALLKFGSVS